MKYKGIDYYPEHWDSAMVIDDLERFRQWGVNTLRIGEFAWHLIEQKQGCFDFTFFDKFIALAKQYDFFIMYGVPCATFPAWIANKYPQVLIQHQQSVQYGGRREYCYNSADYQQLALEMTKQLVRHYALEPAIVSWQIDNEVGHENSDYCICDQCTSAFRSYLKNKYQTIAFLNDTWGNIFWGHTYNGFEEISLPNYTITYFNPSQMLDYYQFRSLSASSFITSLVNQTKKYKGNHQTVTHDFPGNPFSKLYDHNLIANALDYVSYNNYPVWGGLDKPLQPAEIALQLDYFYGLKQQNFTITEQLIGAQGHQYIGYLPRPNQAYLWSMQALAHGCDNLFYFRERTYHKGQEQFCTGVLSPNNKDNRRLLELKNFFADANKLKDFISIRPKPKVAIVYNFDNVSSWKIQPQSKTFDFIQEFQKLYNPFFDLNVPVDIISLDKDLTDYDVIVIPVMQMITMDFADTLNELAKSHRTIIFTYRTGIKDANNNLYHQNFEPNSLKEMTGVEVSDVETLNDDLLTISNQKNETYNISVWRDLISVTTAQILFKYTDEYAEYACITKNLFLQSDVYYLGASLPVDLLIKLIIPILDNHEIGYLLTPQGVEIVTRNSQQIIINHNAISLHYNGENLPGYSVTIL